MADLRGRTIAFLEGRRAAELASLIERHHGVPLAAPSLRELHLRNNLFLSLPEWVGDLKSLRHLDLRGNRLTTLPESLSRLRNLQKLDLRWNKWLKLPGWLQALQRRGCIVLR